MKNRVVALAVNAMLWIAYFQLSRILFFVYQGFTAGYHPLPFLMESAWHGLIMDASMAAYLMVLPSILIMFTYDKWLWYFRFLTVYHTIVIFFVTLIVVADLPVFQAWKFRLDTTPLHYLTQPSEAYASASASPLLFLFLLFVFLVTALFWVFIKANQFSLRKFERANPFAILLSFSLLTGLLIIPIRGGWHTAPMNQSMVYYSHDHFANQLAVNAPWNFFSSVVHNTGSTTNPFATMSQAKADSLTNRMLPTGTLFTQHLKADSATNVVLIIWESLTAKVVAPLGGLSGITPNLTKLSEEGILFTNLYASGDRSDKGLVAILSGYPSQPITSIIKYPRKTISLPSLPKSFKANNYHTSFYYGGETEFANMKSYLLQQGFDRIVDKYSFTPKQMNSKWGAHDHVVFDRLLKDLEKEKSPFFSTIFTLSSHEPYEVPVKTAIPGNNSEQKFLNSHQYTDESLFNFITAAKRRKWWNNSLVIIIADHGHPLPRLNTSRISEFHIPMLWLGGALKHGGFRYTKVASQTDLANTLLAQLGNDTKDYQFGVDLFNDTRTPFAYFSFNNGFGFIGSKRSLVYDNVGKMMIESIGSPAYTDIELGQAYLQNSFGDYLKR
ncbi:LTA synthase family protein [Persicitalea jodogahamensis]